MFSPPAGPAESSGFARDRYTSRLPRMAQKYVYFFGAGKAEGRADMKDLLGGKGANLAEMTNIGLPVPAGFTITTEVCTYYYANGKQYPKELRDEVTDSLKKTETAMGAKLGDAK